LGDFETAGFFDIAFPTGTFVDLDVALAVFFSDACPAFFGDAIFLGLATLLEDGTFAGAFFEGDLEPTFPTAGAVSRLRFVGGPSTSFRFGTAAGALGFGKFALSRFLILKLDAEALRPSDLALGFAGTDGAEALGFGERGCEALLESDFGIVDGLFGSRCFIARP